MCSGDLKHFRHGNMQSTNFPDWAGDEAIMPLLISAPFV